MAVALSIRLLPLSWTCCDRDKLLFQEANIFDCREAEIYKRLYIKSECCSLNKKDCGHTLSGADRNIHFLFWVETVGTNTKLPIPKTQTDSLIFQGTAMLGLLGTATARFAKSGEIMLLFYLVEVEFSLLLEPWWIWLSSAQQSDDLPMPWPWGWPASRVHTLTRGGCRANLGEFRGTSALFPAEGICVLPAAVWNFQGSQQEESVLAGWLGGHT